MAHLLTILKSNFSPLSNRGLDARVGGLPSTCVSLFGNIPEGGIDDFLHIVFENCRDAVQLRRPSSL